MKKTLLLLSILATFTAQAKDTNYKYCSNSAGKVFQIADIEGHKLPPLFKIADDGKLIANEKYAEQDFYDNSHDRMTQDYKFRVSTKNKGILSIFTKKSIKADDLYYSFRVSRDSKGRIKSIVKKSQCVDCKDEVKVEMTYSKGRCVPRQIVSKNLEGESAIVTDTLLCRNLIKSQRKLHKTIDKSAKCIDKLNKMYTDTEASLKAQLDRINKESSEFDSQSDSILKDNLEKMISLNKDLAKPLKIYSGLTDSEDESLSAEEKLGHKSEHLILLSSELIGNCSKSLDTNMLVENKVFKGLDFRKEDKPTVHSPEVEVINTNEVKEE